jgi:hypothetical protein
MSPTSDSANSSSQDSMKQPGNSATQGAARGSAGGNSLSPGSGMTGSPHPSAQSNVGGSSTGNTR